MGYETDTVAAMQGSLNLETVSGAASNGGVVMMGGGASSAATSAGNGVPKTRPQRPCDACRKRKSRCEIPESDSRCVLCTFHKQPCTFVNDPPKKKRRTSDGAADAKRVLPGGGGGVGSGGQLGGAGGAGSNGLGGDGGGGGGAQQQTGSGGVGGQSGTAGAGDDYRKDQTVRDYADLTGPTLLKRTLGLQNHRHSSLLGPTSVYEARLVQLESFRLGDDIPVVAGGSALRKVSGWETFLLTPDMGTRNHGGEVEDLDAIESLVAPHGPELVNLYFRIVHPTFPILHKKVFLEKYARTHREFSPPLLAAVYILALNWWSYSVDLSLLPKPDVGRLEEIAFKTMGDIVHRPKLSTIQAGLLLLQRPEGDSWAMVSQLVGLGQDLGLHLDCTHWRIPGWEKGLRKRLAWALYMQDKWGSLVHGRPSHITEADWAVQLLDESDFPERAADEDDEEGSTEVEKGRVLFCEMIALARILADVLLNFYTVAAETELRNNEAAGVTWVLQKAKPLQLRLKHWFADLPDVLRLQDVTMRKLSSTGYLYLAYYATEITLHRRIVRSLEAESNPELVRVCRQAARTRLVAALDFVNTLRPEHLQSFWYSASKYNFALVGTFISLLWVTSPPSGEDAGFYKKKLDEYRWSLRLSSKNAEIFERAIALMATSTGVLVKGLPDLLLDPDGSASEAMSMRNPSDATSHHSVDDDNNNNAGSSSVLVSPIFDEASVADAAAAGVGLPPSMVANFHHHHHHHQIPWFADTSAVFDPTAADSGFQDVVSVSQEDAQQYMSYRDM